MKKTNLQQEIINAYDAIARFDENRAVKLWSGTKELTKHITRGSVLDLGCGDGRIFELFKDNPDITYTGIDFSPNSITVAIKKYGKYKNATFITGDIANLPDTVTHKSYELILLIGSYHHLLEKTTRTTLLNKCQEMMTRDGTLVLTVWNIWNAHVYTKILPSLLRKLKTTSFTRIRDVGFPFRIGTTTIYRTYHLFLPQELKQEIHTVGLTVFQTNYWRRGKNLVLFCRKT
ncbi:MAG: class I SAM-dependent methyltransferase [Patescibacteria group bacterium]